MDEKEKTPDNGEEKPSEIPPEVAENPDVEDPRLFSPMQEPDRPEPEKRVEQAEVQEEGSVEDKPAGENAE